MRIRNCLDTPGVFTIRQAYNSDVCYRIAWAIIDDGRSYFSTVMIKNDFDHPPVVYPESLLDSILADVRYANPIMRANFPDEWQPRHSNRGLPNTTPSPLLTPSMSQAILHKRGRRHQRDLHPVRALMHGATNAIHSLSK